ncbi:MULTISPECIES: TetR/AcrR family transcriptional regulator [unclassified Microbacterium]|uniref:TetR/AcrR family transcriptional regulator n=1 Tax=unclassified Microbacterium TaxID=2609290 RepID=UPI001D590903|nr:MULTISPECIES: TetR/AcrR family transcriptional regulator [unclassified Microbacterium]CAH0201903.1 Tetracycline repressor protein class A from transposon 1721 [Microbacterium sp. Bi121]HWK78474.1 WHG domain-containing protein [Microbacterium sp.]
MPTPERTSLAEIIEAGREILEDAGPDGLTMQAVAIRVGVRAPSLYKRVRGRDALLSAVAEATIAELAERLDAAGHNLPALAGEFRAYAHERPEGFRLMFTASAPIDALDRAAEPVLATARELVGDEHALDAARLFTAWATGFLQMELAGAFRLGGDVDAAFAYGLDHLRRGLQTAA